MKVGDIVTEIPTFYSKAGLDVVGPQKCRVTYIHPKRRFYTVEFTSDVTGEKWRECFYFFGRCGDVPEHVKETNPRFGEMRKANRKSALYGH